MNETIQNFIDELKALSVAPAIEGDAIRLEFKYTPQPDGSQDPLWRSVLKVFHKYIGFWKSIAVHADHDRERKIARFNIPFKLITKVDLTDDQLIAVAGRISKRI